MAYSNKPLSGIVVPPSTDDQEAHLTGIQSLDPEWPEQLFLWPLPNQLLWLKEGIKLLGVEQTWGPIYPFLPSAQRLASSTESNFAQGREGFPFCDMGTCQWVNGKFSFF